MVLLAAVAASSKLEEAIRYPWLSMAPSWVLRLLKPLLSFWWDDWL